MQVSNIYHRIRLLHVEANKAPFIFLFMTYVLLAYPPLGARIFWWVQAEDRLLEYFSVAFLFFASLTFAQIAISGLLRIKRNRSVPILISFALFLWAAEEISWGQRIFHYSIDFVAVNNAQNEVTLHNLNIVQGYLHIAYFLVFSLLSLLCAISSTSKNKPLLMPSNRLFYFFFLPAMFYGLGTCLSFFPHAFQHPFSTQEIFEFLSAAGIAVYAFETHSLHKI